MYKTILDKFSKQDQVKNRILQKDERVFMRKTHIQDIMDDIKKKYDPNYQNHLK